MNTDRSSALLVSPKYRMFSTKTSAKILRVQSQVRSVKCTIGTSSVSIECILANKRFSPLLPLLTLRGVKQLCGLDSTDRVSRARFLSTECAHLSGRMHADLSPDQLLSAIAGQYPDLRDTWTDGGWQLCAIDATRGHSRDRSLMHSCYILVQVDDCWAFNHRPYGLLELVLGSRDLSFPCVLPQMINFPVL